MALPTIKTVALAVSGFGVATGSVGSGYYYLARPALSNRNSVHVRTNDPQSGELLSSQISAKDSSEEGSFESLGPNLEAVSEGMIQEPLEVEPDEEEFDDEDKQQIIGKLLVVKGPESEGLENDYVLQMVLEGSDEEPTSSIEVNFSIKSNKVEVGKFLKRFNDLVVFDSSTFSGFLKGLKDEKTKFTEIFQGDTYSSLETRVEELANKE
ncbi:hypothetical protein MHLP_02095 [Candidatus Mycoplasma haematolamae str. Purdue]|uniref:Uncharacterized protein n=1 Tax=Mycoplasma haematolamae (strain Purdue) TaxID=1212765 RepID=I7CJH6_MYCHA|nr:hypothetical protein [Candidatus Mycoplasma haematolamae]AFO51999.1 hypothetical protein MHLP_02095 [Candidatus Mycoplasma haematolamae str. Purdue]